MGHADETMPDL
jgi:hypothetical protein